jgi:hypothetical protein
MNTKKLVIEFVTVFAVALVTTAIVTFLWNSIGHGESTIDSVDEKFGSLIQRCDLCKDTGKRMIYFINALSNELAMAL